MTVEKILIADDEVSILQAGKLFFEGKGYQVFTAKNGLEAIDIVKNEKPDCVLLDVVMPEKDGFEVCKELKENDETSKIIVIIFSGNIPEIEKGFDYGANDCIVKPLDWVNLVERIEEIDKENEK